MKTLGTIRRTGTRPCRFFSSAASHRLFASPVGTARRVPEAQYPEPWFFFPVTLSKTLCKVPKCLPRRVYVIFIPLKRAIYRGTTRSNCHE